MTALDWLRRSLMERSRSAYFGPWGYVLEMNERELFAAHVVMTVSRAIDEGRQRALPGIEPPPLKKRHAWPSTKNRRTSAGLPKSGTAKSATGAAPAKRSRLRLVV
jgi:hypothetical protein